MNLHKQVWHDQMESGCDNLVISQCYSARSPECWIEGKSSMSLSSVDLMTFIVREHTAYSLFCEKWAMSSKDEKEINDLLFVAREHKKKADDIAETMNELLWDESLGIYIARNTTTNEKITNRVFLMAFPLFEKLANSSQIKSIIKSVFATDMLSNYGIRSTSKTDPKYNNENIVVPYSNWQGPIWINANVCIAYGLNSYGYSSEAKNFIADRIVDALANDLLEKKEWHECLNAETGSGLAAPGFLSWNTLAATLHSNIASNYNPFQLN